MNVKGSEQSEAVVDIGDNFKFSPTIENLFYLEDIFGKYFRDIRVVNVRLN